VAPPAERRLCGCVCCRHAPGESHAARTPRAAPEREREELAGGLHTRGKAPALKALDPIRPADAIPVEYLSLCGEQREPILP
jgi:hypothetical protein